MSYTPTLWVDGETPVNATNMNKIEQGIQQNSQAIENLPSETESNSVLYTEQNLTEEQKAQARENIGAAQSGNTALVTEELSPSSVITGNFVQKTGELLASDVYVCTDYIDISKAIEGTEVIVSACLYGNAAVVFCDKDKNVVSFINGKTAADYGYTASTDMQDVTITKTADIVYYRASAHINGTYEKPSDFYYSYTIDIDWNGKVESLVSRVSEIEEATRYTDNLKAVYTTLPSSNDFTFVGDELWCGKIDYATEATEIRRYTLRNGELVYKSSIATDFGHLNTLDYDPVNDCLIFGNGANDTETTGNWFAVVPHPLTLGETATLANDAIVYNVDIGFKVQAVWGDGNCGKHNIAILFANNATTIVTVLLTKTNGEFDGNFIVLEEKETDKEIGVQGADYYGGILYIGHDTYNIACVSMSDYSIEDVKKKFYLDDGTAFTGAMQGVYVDKDYEWWYFVIGNNSEMTKVLLQYHR